MNTRKIISIDQEKCNGCGLCIPNCPEGALQVIDGKVRLVSDLFCDGLGACIGYCPQGTITVVEREAEPYEERKVMANIAAQGANTIRAHLEHLRCHGETGLLAEALAYLAEKGIPVPADLAVESAGHSATHAGCPGLQALGMMPEKAEGVRPDAGSELTNWPIQLHLLSPMAPQLQGRDVLLSADCTAFAMGSFHQSLLRGKSLAIACPKLDSDTNVYREKITALIDHAHINTLTVAMMEVPCCKGLLKVVQDARLVAHRKVPVQAITLAIKDGSVIAREWV